jgi:hypothetical protein
MDLRIFHLRNTDLEGRRSQDVSLPHLSGPKPDLPIKY